MDGEVTRSTASGGRRGRDGDQMQIQRNPRHVDNHLANKLVHAAASIESWIVDCIIAPVQE